MHQEFGSILVLALHLSWGWGHLYAWLGLQALFSRWLIHMTAKLVGAWCWQEDFNFLPCGSPQRASPVSPLHSTWLAPEWMIQERTSYKRRQLLWPSLESHALPFPHYTIGWRGQPYAVREGYAQGYKFQETKIIMATLCYNYFKADMFNHRKASLGCHTRTWAWEQAHCYMRLWYQGSSDWDDLVVRIKLRIRYKVYILYQFWNMWVYFQDLKDLSGHKLPKALKINELRKEKRLQGWSRE